MNIPSIRLDLPCMMRSQEEQASYSGILRIVALALGVITLLIGVLLVSGVFHLPKFVQNPLGASFIVLGSLSLLGSLFLRCTLTPHSSYDSSEVVDRRADCGYTSSTWTTDPYTGRETCVETSYVYLKSFLNSEKPEDRELRSRLKDELHIDDLKKRVKDNFNTDSVALSIPQTVYQNSKKRDDQKLFPILKLIFMSREKMLSLSLETIDKFNKEERNILCLRLDCMVPDDAKYPEGTLGHMRTIEDIASHHKIPKDLYLFLTNGQLLSIINAIETKNFWKTDDLLRKHYTKDFFPFGSQYDHPFISKHTLDLLSQLAEEKINIFMPYFECDLIEHLILHHFQLDYSQLRENQVLELFTTCYCSGKEREYNLPLIDVDILNQILPKMAQGQLRALTEKFLKNPDLDLTRLKPKQIKNMGFDEEKMNYLSEKNRQFVENTLKQE